MLSIIAALVCAGLAQPAPETPEPGEPLLYRKVPVPGALLAEGEGLRFGGGIRIGDLTGDGGIDFVVYRSVDDAHDGGGMKPCFVAAFTHNGKVLWQHGQGGVQPCRPGPVAIHDIDGDGANEVICFFVDPAIEAKPTSMANVVVQIRNAQTGEVVRQAAPPQLTACQGQGPNWCHQRLFMADLRGKGRPQDFIVKLGGALLAFDEKLNVLWSYAIQWNEYSKCSAYIPCVGDIDGDGRDEVNGGYFLLDSDGTPFWEKPLGPHMDSVAITEWDDGHVRAICSGHGHVMDKDGNVILELGGERVPHGQEVRVARFDPADPAPQMAIRWNGHTTETILVNTKGEVVNAFDLNFSPNNTGMEIVYWNGPDAPALLCNGGMLWNPLTGEGKALPGLPDPAGPQKMGWYHCIPANICGDEREELVLYNPWDRFVYIYTPQPLDESAYTRYQPGPRQYNARLMD